LTFFKSLFNKFLDFKGYHDPYHQLKLESEIGSVLSGRARYIGKNYDGDYILHTYKLRRNDGWVLKVTKTIATKIYMEDYDSPSTCMTCVDFEIEKDTS
jgi:hypothetical protein